MANALETLYSVALKRDSNRTKQIAAEIGLHKADGTIKADFDVKTFLRAFKVIRPRAYQPFNRESLTVGEREESLGEKIWRKRNKKPEPQNG
jgi:hypothetical protein